MCSFVQFLDPSMDPSCLVSTVQAGGGGGVMVWGIYSWHTLLSTN